MIDCSLTTNFFKEKYRLCNLNSCCNCPMGDYCDADDIAYNTEKAISILQEWSDAHPQKTYMDDFLEKFPNAQLGPNDNLPLACRHGCYGGKENCDQDCIKC